MPGPDQALFTMLNRGAANGFFDWLMPRITNLHQQPWFLVAAVLVAAIAIWKANRRTGAAVVCAIAAIALSDITCSRIIKPLIPRERPCHISAGVMEFSETRIVPGQRCPGSRSFPSNHASNMMALAVTAWWFTRRKARWFWF